MRYKLIGLILLFVIPNVVAQKYEGSWYYNELYDQWEYKTGLLEEVKTTIKWNSLYKQWDIEDSHGNRIGLIKWNSLYKRYDYESYSQHSSYDCYYDPATIYGVGPLAQALRQAFQNAQKYKGAYYSTSTIWSTEETILFYTLVGGTLFLVFCMLITG